MYKILVADDEEELRRAIVRKIDWKSIGFELVGEAENGAEALELVEKTEPDLLLTDIRMPFISGLELARQVREVRPYTQIAFLSGYDDFSYAQEAIRYNIISYMLKPISMSELTENLINIKEKLDHIFEDFARIRKNDFNLSEFLLTVMLDSTRTSGSGRSEERLKKDAEAFGFIGKDSENLRYDVISLDFTDAEGKNCTEYSHVHAVDSILEKYLKHFSSFFLGDKIVSVIAATQGSFDKYMHIIFDELIQSSDRILKLKCRIGVGRARTDLGGLNESYTDSVSALRSVTAESSIRYASDEEIFSGPDIDMVMSKVTDIEEKLKSGNEDELRESLKKAFGELEEKKVSKKETDFFLMELFSGVCRLLYSASPEPDAELIKKDSFMQQLLFLDSELKDSLEHFVTFCINVMRGIAEKKSKSSMDICQHAIKYIEENFSDADLSLMRASADIGVSPNYLSALIKKGTGRSFIDFLTFKRMETAKHLLLDTSMKIREISEACGYNDQHYFSYCFKKYEGLSPNMLRQNASEKA
ncbi:MAG: response regulator [Candidatus Avilachnospira sp.]|jgi:two-component system response regulator YesN